MPLFVRLMWLTGPVEQVRKARPAHERQLEELAEQGRLRAAGSFPDESGFLEIFEAEDRLEAEGIARASPFVEQGLGSWILKEWIQAKGDSQGFPCIATKGGPTDEK